MMNSDTAQAATQRRESPEGYQPIQMAAWCKTLRVEDHMSLRARFGAFLGVFVGYGCSFHLWCPGSFF